MLDMSTKYKFTISILNPVSKYGTWSYLLIQSKRLQKHILVVYNYKSKAANQNGTCQ